MWLVVPTSAVSPELLGEIAGEVMKKVEGGVPDYQPTIHVQTVSGTAIGLMVVLRVSAAAAIETVRHEFIKRLCGAYEREGIKMAP